MLKTIWLPTFIELQKKKKHSMSENNELSTVKWKEGFLNDP